MREFKVGLVLGGAVSAGAYTAGVLDFLIEALDTWEANREPDNHDLPGHRVRIDVMTGASAGSMCAGIAAVVLGRERRDSGDGSFEGNPFYEAWVKGVDIRHLLDPADLQEASGPLRSLLNATQVKRVVDQVIATGGPQVVRPYVHDPLIIRLAQTNLRGVPYEIEMRGNTGQGHAATAHADETTFVLSDSPVPVDTPAHGRGDWRRVPRTNSPTDQGWVALGNAARASGAFPVFLEPVVLQRDRHAEFDDRRFKVAGDNTGSGPFGESREITIKPTWPGGIPTDPYRYLCVDAGVFNNEPLGLAREVLAGSPFARNPREGTRANSSVILIDPFVGAGALGPDGEQEWFGAILPLVHAWTSESRYNRDDIALARHETIYSRFMLAPSRGDSEPATRHPCASGGLAGFAGFFHESFRHHDFLLGRRNCQKFLAEHFSLPKANPLFDGWTAQALDSQDDWTIQDERLGPHLPIIPLFGNCARKIHLPDWPAGKFDPSSIERLIERRVDGVYAKSLGNQAWIIRAWLWVGWRFGGRRKLLGMIGKCIRQSLKDQRLWDGPVERQPDPVEHPDPRDMH